MTTTRAKALAGEMVDSGYVGIVLDRLAGQASQILAADQSWIFLRDPADPGVTIVAAVRGVDQRVLGKRLPIEAERLGGAHGAAIATLEHGGEVRGSLAVRRMEPGRRFQSGDLEILAGLGEIAGAAVRHAQERPTLSSDVRSLLGTLCAALDERDGYTARHSDEVAELACAVGGRLGLEPAAVAELEIAALLHDLGKMRVPMSLLHKPGPLDPDEFATMARHPGWSMEFLMPMPGLEAVASIVRYHHERWDGSGYPDGLNGERIPLASRIISVCDAYHAMTSRRPYRPALGSAAAMCDLWAGAGSQFDPAVVAQIAAVIAPPAVA
jgi:HD-GYP domain-containing protein (c-di-GMP phosphodiesterase class II)